LLGIDGGRQRHAIARPAGSQRHPRGIIYAADSSLVSMAPASGA
jgi:hypothetical protein